MDVTVCIPSIPPRGDYLGDALKSVALQSHPAEAINVLIDHDKRGPAFIRNKLLGAVDTKWVAWLDDDDWFQRQHLERCLTYAVQTGADLVYPWFTVNGGTDPFPTHFGKEWDPNAPRQTTITTVAKTAVLRSVGGFRIYDADAPVDEAGNRAAEDYDLILRLNRAGAKIVHLPERTWVWRHHQRNTSGLPERW